MSMTKPAAQTGNIRAAAQAGLVYVSDETHGIHRRGNGHGFKYFDDHDRVIRDGATLTRIRHLAIPPAYKNVWICPNPMAP